MTDETLALYHQPCPKCGGSDPMTIYYPPNEDPNAFCFSANCGTHFSAKELKELGYDVEVSEEEKNNLVTKSKRDPISKEQLQKVKETTTLKGKNFRGIDDETLAFYGFRTEYNESTGKPSKRYYPVTENYKPVGYKVRVIEDKSFYPVGRYNGNSDFVGQRNFKDGGKRVLIVGGEEDMAASQQMLWGYRKSKGKTGFGREAVVSPVTGEDCVNVVKKQYAWLDSFYEIIIGMDNDEAGEKAVEKILPYLPKGKARIAKWPCKDPNECLENGLDKQFISAFFEAKKQVPAGIVGSSSLSNSIRTEAAKPKIPLPPFMKDLEDRCAGGFPLEYIINMGSASGSGKTTVINEMVYYWIFNSPYKPGIVSMELSQGQYGMSLLSRHIGNKLMLIRDTDKLLDMLDDPIIKEKEKELFNTEEGDDRFMLIDDRDCSLGDLKRKIEEMIISCGCKLIILDPLQDVLDGMTNEDQALFLKWMKGLIKSHGVTFVNINHVRKSRGGDKANSSGAFLTEEDFQGSSSIFKSGGCNIIFNRNKYSEDNIEKNTTDVWVSKIRWTGYTGKIAPWFYDNKTHTMYDLDYYLKNIYKSEF